MLRATSEPHAANEPCAAVRARRSLPGRLGGQSPNTLGSVCFLSHPCGFLLSLRSGKTSQCLRSNHVAALPSPQDRHDVIAGPEP